jgi:hypothetical protein
MEISDILSDNSSASSGIRNRRHSEWVGEDACPRTVIGVISWGVLSIWCYFAGLQLSFWLISEEHVAPSSRLKRKEARNEHEIGSKTKEMRIVVKYYNYEEINARRYFIW